MHLAISFFQKNSHEPVWAAARPSWQSLLVLVFVNHHLWGLDTGSCGTACVHGSTLGVCVVVGFVCYSWYICVVAGFVCVAGVFVCLVVVFVCIVGRFVCVSVKSIAGCTV